MATPRLDIAKRTFEDGFYNGAAPHRNAAKHVVDQVNKCCTAVEQARRDSILRHEVPREPCWATPNEAAEKDTGEECFEAPEPGRWAPI